MKRRKNRQKKHRRKKNQRAKAKAKADAAVEVKVKADKARLAPFRALLMQLVSGSAADSILEKADWKIH
jgi:hypothetical protein